MKNVISPRRAHEETSIQDKERREDRIVSLARKYERFEGVDVETIEATFRLHAAETAIISANRELVRSLGLERILGGRFAVLRTLFFRPGGPMTQLEIANEISLTPPSVSYLIDVLEKDGLVARIDNPRDRRSTHIKLTQEGEELVEGLAPILARRTSEMLAVLRQDEKATLNRLLAKVQEAAEAATAHDGEAN